MLSIGPAFETMLGNVLDEILALIVDIPEDIFNTWLPREVTEGGHEMNTFAAQTVHVVSAARFMTLQGVGGQTIERDREAEFHATTSLANVTATIAQFRTDLHELLDSMTDAQLGEAPAIDRWQDQGWTKGDILLHALDHTALHLGNMQVQKQLWLAARNG